MTTRFVLASTGGRTGIRRGSASARIDQMVSRVACHGRYNVKELMARNQQSQPSLNLLGKRRHFVNRSKALTKASLATGSRIGAAKRRRLHTATAAVKKVSSGTQSGRDWEAPEAAMAAILAAGTTASFALSGQVAKERSNSTDAEAAGPMSGMIKFDESSGNVSHEPSVQKSVNLLHGAQLGTPAADSISNQEVTKLGLRRYARFASRKTRQKPSEASLSFQGAYDASVGALKGNRSTMEDTYCVGDNGRFVAVFDGHGGDGVAAFLRDRLYKAFVRNLEKNQAMKNEVSPTVDSRISALSGAFHEIEKTVMKLDALQYQGSTACAVVMHEEENGQKTLVTANVGDSRAILSRRGRAVNLTRDHKPNDEMELERITSMGEKVTFDRQGQVYRVRSLALARSIGDRFAKPAVSGEPDVMGFPISEKGEDEFVILASDGLWDVMTSQEVVSFVHKNLRAAGKKSYQDVRSKITDLVANEALRRGSDDNICVALVWLK